MDPSADKDAFLIADLARQGSFNYRREYTPEQQAMHRLAITYDKLRKSLQRHYARLRAQVELLFPELLKLLNLDTLTARHVLTHYLLPEDTLTLEIDRAAAALMEISRNQHGRQTLEKLQLLARRSIGVPQSEPERRVQRLTMDAWLSLIEALTAQIRTVERPLVHLAQSSVWPATLRLRLRNVQRPPPHHPSGQRSPALGALSDGQGDEQVCTRSPG